MEDENEQKQTMDNVLDALRENHRVVRIDEGTNYMVVPNERILLIEACEANFPPHFINKHRYIPEGARDVESLGRVKLHHADQRPTIFHTKNLEKAKNLVEKIYRHASRGEDIELGEKEGVLQVVKGEVVAAQYDSPQDYSFKSLTHEQQAVCFSCGKSIQVSSFGEGFECPETGELERLELLDLDAFELRDIDLTCLVESDDDEDNDHTNKNVRPNKLSEKPEGYEVEPPKRFKDRFKRWT